MIAVTAGENSEFVQRSRRRFSLKDSRKKVYTKSNQNVVLVC